MAKQFGFKRIVGLFMAVMIGIGALIGSGGFALHSEGAVSIGPLGLVATFGMGLLTLFAALSFSEHGAVAPLHADECSFVSRRPPSVVVFLANWFFWIGTPLACALYTAIAFATQSDFFAREASF